MRKQVINEYYVNLEYNVGSKEKALMEISTLSKRIKFMDVNDFSKRFLETASIIKKNLSVFKSACKHIDMITTILEYLTNFGVKLMFDNGLGTKYDKEEIILSLVLTIFNVCGEHEVQLFVENAIIKNSTLYEIRYKRLKNELLNQTNEMILLEDSDLYTVISYLMITGHSRINKIWVQVPIKQKFLSLINNFRLKNFSIHTFKSKTDLARRTSYNMNITSIWSEDVTGAKSLATLLDRDVIFINMHMDLYGGVMLLPYVKVFDQIVHGRFKRFNFNSFKDYSIQPRKNEVNFSRISDTTQFMLIYSLFYDGMWHKPVKGMYWKHNDMSLWANATSEDVKMCINSAIKGFNIWRTWSFASKISSLSELVDILNYNDKSSLGDIVSKLIACTHFHERSLLSPQNDKLEIIESRTSRGVIILKEKNEEVLFHRLTQILISGNSAIVIADANSCTLAPYCDMFSASKIPPGVINFLSNQNTSDLESSLYATDYANYENQLFTESDPEKTYINLTISKQTILPLK